jgi:hypothetical protein
MSLFQQDNGTQSDQHRKIYAIYEIIYTLVDFSAALLFVIGSVMFFYNSWLIPGTWCFLIGSILFGAKPALRFARELHYLAIGETDQLARRLKDE